MLCSERRCDLLLMVKINVSITVAIGEIVETIRWRYVDCFFSLLNNDLKKIQRHSLKSAIRQAEMEGHTIPFMRCCQPRCGLTKSAIGWFLEELRWPTVLTIILEHSLFWI